MRKKMILFGVVLCLALLAAGLWRYMDQRKNGDEIEYLIGVSQANLRDPWRLVLNQELESEASQYDHVRLIITDAASDTQKQKEDVERLLELGIDLLIISLHDAEEMTPFIKEVYEQIPVIVMDRSVEGFDYTLFIGPDNQLIGRQAGEKAVEMLGSSGSILELKNPLSPASQDKSTGFMEALADQRNIEIYECRVVPEFRDEAEDAIYLIEDLLSSIDIIFAHNDFMALGAHKALDNLGYDIPIIGIDGFEGEDNGLAMVADGRIYSTVACPAGGKEAIQFALDILNEVSGVPKQIILRSHMVTEDNIQAFTNQEEALAASSEGIINVGYSQVGSESAWRLANTESIQEAARDQSINLIYEDANQSQEKQIEAIRRFIELKVDVIVVSPVVDSGWDDILQEVKAAGIPVILSDRKIKADDDSLIMTYIGADFIEEGRRAARWITEADKAQGKKKVNIMEIQGTIGASPTIERNKGFMDYLQSYDDYQVKYSASGDFTYEEGQAVVLKYLDTNDWDIDIIFAHNDDMALGAISALESRGIEPGTDVKIVSVDGTKEAFQAMIDGKLNCAVECSPLLGPQLMKAIQDLMSGKELPLRIITEEKVYTMDEAKDLIKYRRY